MISPSYAHVGGFIIFQLRCLGVADVIDRNILAPCFFFLGGEINISSFGTSQYFTTHDRSPHHLDMF
jgi:hypothetical protein